MQYLKRKQQADANNANGMWYSYVLELDDGTFYVGETGDLKARLAEHAINGAERTKGRNWTLRMAIPFASRTQAEYSEKRIQEALNRGPANVQAMIDQFHTIAEMVRPHKTLDELETERAEYHNGMRRAFHHSPPMMGFRTTSCGWSLPHHGTDSWDDLRNYLEVEDKVGWENSRLGRPVCRQCLAKAPA